MSGEEKRNVASDDSQTTDVALVLVLVRDAVALDLNPNQMTDDLIDEKF